MQPKKVRHFQQEIIKLALQELTNEIMVDHKCLIFSHVLETRANILIN